jgi:hypothetical protein
VGTAAVVRGTAERMQRTGEISMQHARWSPWRDYRAGDMILAPGDNGLPLPMRVRQVTLTRTARGVVAGNLILTDRFEDHDLRVARMLAGLNVEP